MLAFFGALAGLLLAFGLLRGVDCGPPAPVAERAPDTIGPAGASLHSCRSARDRCALQSRSRFHGLAPRPQLLPEGGRSFQLFKPGPRAHSRLARYHPDRAVNDSPLSPPASLFERSITCTRKNSASQRKAWLHSTRRLRWINIATASNGWSYQRSLMERLENSPGHPGGCRHQSAAAYRLPQLPGASVPTATRYSKHLAAWNNASLLRSTSP